MDEGAENEPSEGAPGGEGGLCPHKWLPGSAVAHLPLIPTPRLTFASSFLCSPYLPVHLSPYPRLASDPLTTATAHVCATATRQGAGHAYLFLDIFGPRHTRYILRAHNSGARLVDIRKLSRDDRARLIVRDHRLFRGERWEWTSRERRNIFLARHVRKERERMRKKEHALLDFPSFIIAFYLCAALSTSTWSGSVNWFPKCCCVLHASGVYLRAINLLVRERLYFNYDNNDRYRSLDL